MIVLDDEYREMLRAGLYPDYVRVRLTQTKPDQIDKTKSEQVEQNGMNEEETLYEVVAGPKGAS